MADGWTAYVDRRRPRRQAFRLSVFVFAMAVPNAPIVGQNYGAGHLARIRSAFAIAAVVGVGVGYFAFSR